MIIVRANARNATYISDDLITSGSVGIPVTFNLSEDFDGLSCIAVFEGSGTARDVALMSDNTCVVPHEVVATAGGYLRIGIYANNSEGTIVIPTVWAGSKMILPGTTPSEVDPSEPTPSWAAQVQEMATEALEIAQNVEDMSVEAETLPPGSPLNVEKTIDPETGAVTLTFYLAPGRDGVSPTIAVEEITGGHRVTITDAQGTRSFDVLDGTNGDDGRGIASAVMNADYTLTLTYTDGISYTTPSLRGAPGQDGYSPVASVSKSGKVATISITDKQGTTTVTVSDGEDGAPGISPTITVTDITGGHRVTITDATGAHPFDVMDGDNYVLTAQDKADIAAEVDVPVQDVQVNGTSILSGGVANVPVAGAEFGVVKTDSSNGIYTTDFGKLRISAATNVGIKNGSDSSKPIVPTFQHAATFYGLAKAAGSDMASSSNPVGTYTDAAKIAIQKMLGISQQGELIADVTVAEDVTEILVTTDLSEQPFQLRKLIAIFTAGQSTTGTRDSFYGQIIGIRSDDTPTSTSFPSQTYVTATSTMLSRIEIEAVNGLPLIMQSVVAAGDGSTQPLSSMVKPFIFKAITGFRIYQSGPTKSLIPAGANLKVYGIRAY